MATNPTDQAILRMGTSVEQLPDVIASVEALLTNLSSTIRDAADDPVQINAIADSLDAQKARLAAMVVAHTPAAPTP